MGERKPIRTITQQKAFEIWNIEDLGEEEQLAMRDAVVAYRKSTNTEFIAGACAVACNGEKAVKHNHTNEPGRGQKGHAEMLALQALYETVNPSDRRLKLLALAASYFKQELFRCQQQYDSGAVVGHVGELDVHRICGRCLKMLSDYTGNNLPNVHNGVRSEPWDPIILLMMGTGQVLRTTLSTLYPLPHVPQQTSTRPWAEADEEKQVRSPDNNKKR